MTSTPNQPTPAGLDDIQLAPCPGCPNCVSSDAATGTSHYITPFALYVSAPQAWTTLREILQSQPRTKIVTHHDNYLHAEVSSRIFGFIDDMEFHLRPEQASIAVRSGARLGYYDFGVNRKRINKLRDQLRAKGVIS
jgi:uncharacterized protein (DUF1499 family)